MSSLFNIKSKYCINKIFDFLPIKLYYKIPKRNHKLLQYLNLSQDSYKNYYISQNICSFSKIFKPNYDIQQYSNYLYTKIKNEIKTNNENNTNEINEIKSEILYKCINNAAFNIDLYIENNDWEDIIENVHNLKLIISENLLYYNIKEPNSLIKLEEYKDNFVEIEINNVYNFSDQIFSKFLYILIEIFTKKGVDNNNYIFDNKKTNNHKIKKLSFYNQKANEGGFIILKILSKVLVLETIEELCIDATLLSSTYIQDNFYLIKSLKIYNFILENKKEDLRNEFLFNFLNNNNNNNNNSQTNNYLQYYKSFLILIYI